MGRAKRSTNNNRQQRNSKKETQARRRFEKPCGSCANGIDIKKHAYVLVPGVDYDHPVFYHWDCSPREYKQAFYDEE